MKRFFKKLGRFVWLVWAWIFMIFYVGATFPLAISWAKMQYYDSITMEEAVDRVVRGEENGYVVEAMQVIKAQSREKDREVVEAFSKVAHKISPLFLFELARRSWKTDMNEAAFWTTTGRFRLRYDALRCLEPGAVDLSIEIANRMTPVEIESYLQEDKEHLKTALQKTLDWDKEHPPENDPRYICTVAKKLNLTKSDMLLLVTEWPWIHLTLRQQAVDFIQDAAPPPGALLPEKAAP